MTPLLKFFLQVFDWKRRFQAIKTTSNKSIANSGAGPWSSRLHITISLGSGGRNSFEH